MTLPINYLYFGLFLISTTCLHLYQLSLIPQVTFLHRCFYAIYIVSQSVLETSILMIIGDLIRKKGSRTIHLAFIAVTFSLLLLHAIDFPLIRIMDMTVWYALDFVLAESFTNFVEMLRASNVSLTVWIVMGCSLFLIPLIGVALFYFTDQIARKKALSFRYSTISLSVVTVTVCMILFDFKMYHVFSPANHEKCLKALPWKTTLFATPHPHLRLGKKLVDKPSESHYLTELSHISLPMDKKPNIFLLIVESLREDFLTPTVAPHLTAFKRECSPWRHTISGANATQFSWLSIYHSDYPFYWERRQPQHWQNGSLPLQILKKIGYKIHLFSSSRLAYYQMDDILFGKDHHLADTFEIFTQDSSRPIYENDIACMESVLHHLDPSSEGNIFLIFLDATHFDYSWPPNQIIAQAPEKIDYWNVARATGVEGVKNRYRNAVHFIDGLIGKLFTKLQATQEAVIVVTGDHGEEFLEQGNIFHASHLSSMQTTVPIYCRLGTTAGTPQELACHVDIFPTILHHVLGKDYFTTWFDGESLLRPRRKNFAISTRYNASRTPFEFLIHNGAYQLVARFDNRRNIFDAQALDLISLKNGMDQPLDIHLDQVKKEFTPVFELLFNR